MVALMGEACITGLQQYLMGTSGPSVLTEEQQANISAAQHANAARATVIQTDRRWEVAKGSGAYQSGKIMFRVDSKLIAFYSDGVMCYPQLIVWAVEMRRMMDVGVPVGIIRHLKETWDTQQTLGVYEEAAVSWKEQLQKELQSTNRVAEGWNALQRKMKKPS